MTVASFLGVVVTAVVTSAVSFEIGARTQRRHAEIDDDAPIEDLINQFPGELGEFLRSARYADMILSIGHDPDAPPTAGRYEIACYAKSDVIGMGDVYGAALETAADRVREGWSE